MSGTTEDDAANHGLVASLLPAGHSNHGSDDGDNQADDPATPPTVEVGLWTLFLRLIDADFS